MEVLLSRLEIFSLVPELYMNSGTLRHRYIIFK